jgi:uncharacterized protein
MANTVVLGDAGILKEGKLRWARALLWLAVLAVLSILVFNLSADGSLRLSAILSGDVFTTRAHAPSPARLIAVIVGSIAMLTSYAFAVALGERRTPSELALRPAIPELLMGLGIGGALIGLIVAIMWTAGWVTITATAVTDILESVKESVQSGVIEETLIRLIIFRLLWRAMGVWPAFLVTALVFGALHLSNPGATLFSAACLVAGEGIGAGLYLLTGRPWMSIGMHAGWNFMQGWVFGAVVSGTDLFAGGPLQTHPAPNLSNIFSGGGFGPESSLASLGVSLIASAICLGLAWRRGRFASNRLTS